MPNKPRKLFRTKLSRQTAIKAALVSAIVLACIIYLTWDILAGGPLMRFLTSRDQLIAAVNSWGAFGPILYILLQVIQTVVAPIPGQVVGSIGGFLFGPWGILWTAIGTLIGCYIVFRLARRFGRPLLEKIFQKSAIDRFDFIINSPSASLILLLIFLMPGFPDDLICYLAGLTALPIYHLMMIVLLGRLPVIAVINFLADNLTTNLPVVIIVSILSLVILAVAVWQRERIITFAKREPGKKRTLHAEPQKPNPKSNPRKEQK